MIDIDFRYVMRLVQHGNGYERIEKVLQWRKNVRKDFVRYTETEWTDWQDVRTEEE